MKRFLYLFIALSAFLAVSCNQVLEQFTVTPTALEFTGEAGMQTVSVTTGDTWALKISDGASWLTTSHTYGKTSAQVKVSVTKNSPVERSGSIVFSSSITSE